MRLVANTVPAETPIVKFFTPDKRDKGLIEFHNTEVAKYTPLDVGTAHPNTRDYPGYKLGKQFNLPNDEKWVVRIWVTEEVGAEWFGYAVKYLAESAAHPIFIRNQREPRNTYIAKTKGQPLKSVYKLTITGAGTGYTPGTFPALTFAGGAGTGAAGRGVVAPNGTISEFVLDDGGDNYTSSPTFTVAAPPSGTTATGTALIQSATALLTVEEASEYPQDSEFYGLYLNVVRIYQTLPGPTLPKDSYDNDVGAVEQSEQQIIAVGNEAGAIAISAGVVTKTEYESTENVSILKKILTKFSLPGPQLAGQTIDETFGVVIQFTKQMVVAASAGLGTAWRTIKPISSVQSEITDINIAALTTFLTSYSLPFPGTANLDLPDTLVSLTGIMETSNHAGEYINDNAFGEAVDHGQWSVNVRGEGSGGGKIIPDLRPNIVRTKANNVPTMHYLFFLPYPVTAAAFNTKLAALVGASVNAWPKFREQIHSFTGTGRSLDLTANVDGYASESWDGNVLSYTSGHGSSRRGEMHLRSFGFPPTIHGAVSISTNTQTLTLDTVEAHSIVGSAFPGLDEDVVLDSEQITATISPTSVSATSGTSVIPTSGKYLLDSHSRPWKHGFVECEGEVLDFSDV